MDSDLAESKEMELEEPSGGISLVPKKGQCRMRLNWKQRAFTVVHYNGNPKITAVSKWTHKSRSKELLKRLQSEFSPRVQGLKSVYPEKHPGLDEKMLQRFGNSGSLEWFSRIIRKQWFL